MSHNISHTMLFCLHLYSITGVMFHLILPENNLFMEKITSQLTGTWLTFRALLQLFVTYYEASYVII